ncbi:uncharacterized protein LOC111892508 isoform X2 [Lactuca sativa]|uniref:Uncharacterized protein n=1 Tax=Lactuca sativa TaxID=4236 RepID=A0A9R1VK81_LACSA|nr:uncharacterized protein LOC111892508 isoform X2 [Lactuca sativa]KAJ0206171.1 hypothetical protein LSAT_V11C500280530 [Lactuca sativa]
MPGSIQVSVLDFKELPSSSNSVKVALGKVEHEAGEKETFSFPLTNLRDNLIISIQDSEGNQISHSGIRTMSIIEKGTWDDLFPIEGGGLIHMKLQFILNDEERNRIRSVREAAMKKKQAEILNSRLRKTESAKSLTSLLQRHEVSDVLRDTSSQYFQRSSSNNDAAKARSLNLLDDISLKAAESSHVIKEESFQKQSFTDPTDKKEETSFPPTIKTQASQTDLIKNTEAEKTDLSGDKLYEQNLEEKITSDINITNKETTSTPSLQETEVNTIKANEIQPSLQESVEDTNIHASESKPSNDEKLDKQNLEEKIKKSKLSTSSQETEVNTIKNNEKRLQETSSQDITSSRSIIAKKIKSFSPKVEGEQDKITPRNIKKMISVFESSISQDRTPLKPLSMKSYKLGTLRVKDNDQKLETSSSTRLRNSFSMSDLQKNINVTKEEQDGFENFVTPSETNDSNNEEKFSLMETNTKKLPETCEEDATVSGRKPLDNEKSIEHIENESVNGGMSSNDNHEDFEHDIDCKIEEKDHQEKIVASNSIPEIVVKGEVQCGNDENVKQGEEIVHILGNSSPKSVDEEASNGSVKQVIKIAIVVGFGVLVFFLRQREHRKGKKKENYRALKNQVFMNKRGSIEEQRVKFGVMKMS